MHKTALINGVTGQDGSYLSEFLLEKNYRITGIVRDIAKAKQSWEPDLLSSIELVEWNMLGQQRITEIFATCQPAEFYNFAAYSSGSGMYDDPVGIGQTNGLAVVYMLEAIREVDNKIRFCQASSREIFGEADESPQTEQTSVSPRSPYGAAKLYADNMIQIYRERYNLFACSAILYNHESPRRRSEFVTRKITHEAARIKLGEVDELHLGNLDSRRDWGFAGDFVHAMWLMLQQNNPDDYILATGEAHSVRDLCEIAFGFLNLDYRDYVRDDKSAFRQAESHQLVGSIDKARNILGWKPRVGFEELVQMMVKADMSLLK